MTDWLEVYKKFPERFEEHSRSLDEIESRIFTSSLFNSPSITQAWIDISLTHNRPKATHIILDRWDVPKDDLTIKERISYYQLVSSSKNKE